MEILNVNRTDILKIIEPIFIEVLDDKDLEINESSNANNLPGWDSLNHIYLIVAIEKRFNLKFTTEQIMSWNNVGDMIDYIIVNV